MKLQRDLVANEFRSCIFFMKSEDLGGKTTKFASISKAFDTARN
jgi:hypothetical protein